jgi:hypothetical protein
MRYEYASFNIICSVHCDYSHPHTKTNAQNLHKIINHPHTWTLLYVSAMSSWGWRFFAETCRSVYVYRWFVIIYKLCTFVIVYWLLRICPIGKMILTGESRKSGDRSVSGYLIPLTVSFHQCPLFLFFYLPRILLAVASIVKYNTSLFLPWQTDKLRAYYWTLFYKIRTLRCLSV